MAGSKVVRMPGSAARLTFESLERKVAIQYENGAVSIFDPEEAWRDSYYLTASEAKQLAEWLQREVQ